MTSIFVSLHPEKPLGAFLTAVCFSRHCKPVLVVWCRLPFVSLPFSAHLRFMQTARGVADVDSDERPMRNPNKAGDSRTLARGRSREASILLACLLARSRLARSRPPFSRLPAVFLQLACRGMNLPPEPRAVCLLHWNYWAPLLLPLCARIKKS